jgi:hypothetical protein
MPGHAIVHLAMPESVGVAASCYAVIAGAAHDDLAIVHAGTWRTRLRIQGAI